MTFIFILFYTTTENIQFQYSMFNFKIVIKDINYRHRLPIKIFFISKKMLHK